MEEPGGRAEGLRHRMQETRNQLYRDVGGLVRDARGAVNWRRYVARYPLWAVGAAAALGYLVVPKRRKSVELNAETLAELARDKRLVIRIEGQGEKSAGMADSLIATALAFASRAAAGWFRKQVTNYMSQAPRSYRDERRPYTPRPERE